MYLHWIIGMVILYMVNGKKVSGMARKSARPKYLLVKIENDENAVQGERTVLIQTHKLVLLM